MRYRPLRGASERSCSSPSTPPLPPPISPPPRSGCATTVNPRPLAAESSTSLIFDPVPLSTQPLGATFVSMDDELMTSRSGLVLLPTEETLPSFFDRVWDNDMVSSGFKIGSHNLLSRHRRGCRKRGYENSRMNRYSAGHRHRRPICISDAVEIPHHQDTVFRCSRTPRSSNCEWAQSSVNERPSSPNSPRLPKR